MLFPGCRIRVVESNVKGTTGPIPESMGFVSEYRQHYNMVELQRAVWSRYGKTGKKRMETGNFACVMGGTSPFITKRRHGKIELAERGNIQEMDILEFMCWAYSILKLKKPEWEHQEMRKLLRSQFDMKVGKYSIRRSDLTHNQYIDSPAGREAIANICRHMRHLYYKRMVRAIKELIKHTYQIVQKDVVRQEAKTGKSFTPESYAQFVRDGLVSGGVTNTYITLFNKFNHDAFLYPRAEHLCKDNAWLLEIVKQYKKQT
jgi:hypothetical protein